MRSHPYLRGSLLALVLLFGQWLNFEHSSEHRAFSNAKQNCEFCVHAQGLLPGLAALPQVAAASVVHESPTLISSYVFSVAAPSYYSIRGPPNCAT